MSSHPVCDPSAQWYSNYVNSNNSVSPQQLQLPADLPRGCRKLVQDLRKRHPGTRDGDQRENHTKIDLQPMLLQYQREDVLRIVHDFGSRAFLAHEMGCGKTLISIAAAKAYLETRLVSSSSLMLIIICPSYLKANWKNELLKWKYVQSADAICILNKKTDAVITTANTSHAVVIVSYDIAASIVDELNALKQRGAIGAVILDESHYIKSRTSRRFKQLSLFLDQTYIGALLLLSGTPITNGVRDFWTQLHLLYPEYFDNYFDFSIRYCDGKRGVFGWEDRGATNVDELNYLLENVCLIRRLKKDVLQDLPKQRRMAVYIDVAITATMRKTHAKVAQLNQRLGQIAVTINERHARKWFNQRQQLISKLFNDLAVIKAPAVTAFLGDLDSEKTIVFCHHHAMLDAIEAYVRDTLQVKYIRIDGKTKMSERQVLTQSFVSTKDNIQIAILGIKACSTGLNFTPVRRMVFASLLWDPATLMQAEARIHRIGASTCDHVEYYYLIANQTIDETMFNRIQDKYRVSDAVVDNYRTKDDFNFLF